MKKIILYISICFCILSSFAQTEAIPSFIIPVRNSLKCNRFLINPTFSYVREKAAHLTFYNKRQWTAFENSPQTYMVSYSGRFKDSQGIGLGLFQQTYGISTVFGGIANFVHNVEVNEENNVSFGINAGYFKSALNSSRVITNSPDPFLETIPTGSFFVLNPALNYGSSFIDIGISLNNWVLYDLNSKLLVTDNIEKNIELHLMHTGYLSLNGFLDKSKFSGIVKSEFRKDKTILSSVAMLTIPLGVWAQFGYNSIYGLSAGLGLNITQNLALEYNYERGLNNLTNFGASHEITLAIKINNNNYFYDDDELGSLYVSNLIKGTPRSKSNKKENKPKFDKRDKSKSSVQQKNVISENIEQKSLQKEILTESQVSEIKTTPKKILEEVEPTIVEIEDSNSDEITQDTIQETTTEIVQLEPETKVVEKDSIATNSPTEVSIVKDDSTNKEVPLTNKEFKAIDNIAKDVAQTTNKQQQLLNRLTQTVANKQKDLLEMKEENDLSEKGIFKEPKSFKNTSSEKAELEIVRTDLLDVIKVQKEKIREFENLYAEQLRKNNSDEGALKKYYDTIQDLKEEHLKAVQTNVDLNKSLEEIELATEIEKRRRIKRASFVNVEGRFAQDMETLKRIKETTVSTTTPFQASDFDNGEEQAEVQIVKAIKNVPAGYYLVIAVHNEISKRDDFLTKVVASGDKNINFFYDPNSSKYFIYYDSFDSIEAAKNALKDKGTKPYKNQISIVKLEN